MYENPIRQIGGAISSYGATGTSGGITSATWNPPSPEVSVLDAASRDVNNAVDQLAELANRARSIADAVFGPAPESKDAQGNMPPTSGRIEALSRANGNLFTVISALRNQIDRLTCL